MVTEFVRPVLPATSMVTKNVAKVTGIVLKVTRIVGSLELLDT
jgi:hypothetical protein